MFSGLRFVHPQVLLGLPIILFFLWWSSRGRLAHRRSLGYSSLTLVEWSKSAVPLRLSRQSPILIILFWTLLLLALAQPQQRIGEKPQTKEGIDIVLCLDTSTSMRAEDLLPNREEAAKQVSKTFVKQRPNDRIGLVVFSAIALTQCPLTTDHNTLNVLLDRVQPGMTQRDGTAIGNGIATAVNRLKDVPGKSKVIVLLTDGRNNAGEIEPTRAAKLAASFGIRIYAIGVGEESVGMLNSVMGGGIDFESLREIAQVTNGKAFRATNTQGLSEVYAEINQLERTKHKEKPEVLYAELMAIPGLGALLVLAFFIGARQRKEVS